MLLLLADFDVSPKPFPSVSFRLPWSWRILGTWCQVDQDINNPRIHIYASGNTSRISATKSLQSTVPQPRNAVCTICQSDGIQVLSFTFRCTWHGLSPQRVEARSVSSFLANCTHLNLQLRRLRRTPKGFEVGRSRSFMAGRLFREALQVKAVATFSVLLTSVVHLIAMRTGLSALEK